MSERKNLEERIKKQVGSTSTMQRRSVLERVAVLRANARALMGEDWKPALDDGTLVRKVVGSPH